MSKRLGAVYKGRPANGDGVVLTFPEGGGLWKFRRPKISEKYFHICFLNISQSSITVSVVLF